MPNQALKEMVEQTEVSRAEIQRSLGRIEGQLDSIVKSFNQHMIDDVVNFKEVNVNISLINRKIWTYAGAVTVILFTLTHSDKLIALIK